MFLDKSKIESGLSENPALDAITDEEVEEIVRQLWGEMRSNVIGHDELLFEIIKLKKCNLKEANNMLAKINSLGLTICEPIGPYGDYDLEKFGLMRGYIIDSEIQEKRKRQKEEYKRLEKNEKEREKKFIEKHGSDMERWPEEVWQEYFSDEDD